MTPCTHGYRPKSCVVCLTQMRDDVLRRLCASLDIPPRVVGYGWLVPDPNPFPRFRLWGQR